MTSSRLSPSIGPDHDFPSLGIAVNHTLHFTNDRLGTLFETPKIRAVSKGVAGRLLSTLISCRILFNYTPRRLPISWILKAPRPGRARLQSRRESLGIESTRPY